MPDDTTAPVTADPETVTASFDDVAQVAQHLKTYGEGETWHAACRLLDALRVASERAAATTPATAEGLRERLIEAELAAHVELMSDGHPSVIAHSNEDAADRAIAALAAEPGCLPERMAEALYASTGVSVPWSAIDADPDFHLVAKKYREFAAVARGVRDEQMASLAAENAQLRARVEHAEGELSSLRDHGTRWETEKARADKAEANLAVAVQRAGQAHADAERKIADVMDRTESELGRLRAELAEMTMARNVLAQLYDELDGKTTDDRVNEAEGQAAKLRDQLFQAEAERDRYRLAWQSARERAKASSAWQNAQDWHEVATTAEAQVAAIRTLITEDYGTDYDDEDVPAAVERLMRHLSAHEADVQRLRQSKNEALERREAQVAALRREQAAEREGWRKQLALTDSLRQNHLDAAAAAVERAEQAERELAEAKQAVRTAQITHIREEHSDRMHDSECSGCRALVPLSAAMPSRPDDPEEIRRLAQAAESTED